MPQYKITHALGNCAYSVQLGTEYVKENIPIPIEPDPPEYDIEMAQAFGSSPEQHWKLHFTNVVKIDDVNFHFFWTWVLEDD